MLSSSGALWPDDHFNLAAHEVSDELWHPSVIAVKEVVPPRACGSALESGSSMSLQGGC
jgi:hypothetical protein